MHDRLLDPLGDLGRAQAAARLQQLDQLLGAEHLAPLAPHLGDAVGVEDEHVALLELDDDVGEQRLGVGAEQRAEPADLLDAAVGVHDERQRVAAAGQLEPHVAGHDLHVGVGDRAEAPVGDLLAQLAVQQRQHAAGAVLVGGGGAQRVAGQRGDRGGLRALALDVADQRRPAAVAGAVEVVEVAAELDALAGGVEAHGGRQAGDGGQRARPQRALQRARDRALAAVQPRVGDRPRRELAELGEERVVAAR